MDLGLSGKRALVTGASKGIGKGVATALAEEGCSVVLVSRTLTDLETAAAEIRAATGREATPIAKDLSRSDSVAELLAEAGTPDILVNNAGAIPGGDLATIVEPSWRKAWDLKVFGYINLCRAFYAAMKGRGGGVIVNITGLAADRSDADYIAGTAGNASLNAFTRALGSRSLGDGIRVLAVSPGPVETERLVTLMRTKAETDLGDAQRWQSYLGRLPLGRAASVREVADVVAFLASARASYVSGTVLTLDGGHGSNAASFS